MTPGERIDVTDGTGTRISGIVESADRDLVVLVEAVTTEPQPSPRVVVVQAIPKGDRGELAVEVLTEVGVDEIVPWSAQRCVAVWRDERAAKSRARWEGAAREAAKQSRRAHIPRVHAVASLATVEELIAEATLAVVLDEASSRPISSITAPAEGSVVIVVGPEGGITAEESHALARAGAVSVRLGPSVLRTSTAGVVAAGILLAGSARWGMEGSLA